jgi:hypothetical protein
MTSQIDLFLSDLPLYSSSTPSRPLSLVLPDNLGPLFISSLGRARTNRRRGRPAPLIMDPASEKSALLRGSTGMGPERQSTQRKIVSSFLSPPAANAPKPRDFSFVLEKGILPNSPLSACTFARSPTSSSYSPLSSPTYNYKKPRLRRVKPMASEALREARRQGEWEELRMAMEEGVEAYCLGTTF